MKALQIKVKLKNFAYSNYRTILMSPSNTFKELNQCIQSLFGFDNMHLWSFICFQNNQPSFEITDPFEDDLDSPIPKYSTEIKLSQIFLEKDIKKLIYEYDFGDSWEFDVYFEKEVETEDKLPKVLRWKGIWLLEDCGGPWWLEDLIEIYNNTDIEEAEDRWWEAWDEFKEIIEELFEDTDWKNFPSEELLYE